MISSVLNKKLHLVAALTLCDGVRLSETVIRLSQTVCSNKTEHSHLMTLVSMTHIVASFEIKISLLNDTGKWPSTMTSVLQLCRSGGPLKETVTIRKSLEQFGVNTPYG